MVCGFVIVITKIPLLRETEKAYEEFDMFRLQWNYIIYRGENIITEYSLRAYFRLTS